MAKVGFWLQGSHGKLGGANLSQSPGGATILKTNSHPTNPNTVKQCIARAKFKLMSQIAAAFKSVIAIPRNGELSPRNQFFTQNYPLVNYAEPIADMGDVAWLNWPDLQLTKSLIGLSSDNIEFTKENNTVEVNVDGLEGYEKAVIVKVFTDADTEKFKRQEAIVVDVANGVATTSFTDGGGFAGVLTYAYNVDESKLSSVAYDEYSALTGESPLAILGFVRKYVADGVDVTKTAGKKYSE